jgi:hypothetical protein
VEACVQSRVIPCEICGEQGGNGTVSPQLVAVSLSVPLYNCSTQCLNITVTGVGQGSSVGVPTGWTARGSNPDMGRDFLHPYRPAVCSTQPPIRWKLGLFPGGKVAGAWC